MCVIVFQSLEEKIIGILHKDRYDIDRLSENNVCKMNFQKWFYWMTFFCLSPILAITRLHLILSYSCILHFTDTTNKGWIVSVK